MKTKYVVFAVFGLVAIGMVIAVAMSRSHAGYPMISGLSNQRIEMNTQTDAIPFNVFDDKTPADALMLSYKCNKPRLVPVDDSHIILGGSGRNRTVQVIPAHDQTGTATIGIVIKDTDGETNMSTFSVEVTRPLRIP